MLRFLSLATVVSAQNLGAYLSPCPATAPVAALSTQIVNGYALATDAVCSVGPPGEGYTTCPAPSVFDAFFTDTDAYFRCAASLSATCNGGCPEHELCISTLIPSSSDPFFFCGVPCAGGFYLCDDTATKYLDPSFTAFCDPVADQCATCSSPTLMNHEGTCQPSGVVSALPVRASARKRAYTVGLQAEIGELDCPRATKKCWMSDGDDWECIAIMEDLESCGGCPSDDGVDCASLPGIAFGGVTCAQGRCIAHKCLVDKGYTLVNSTCVPNFTAKDESHTGNPDEPSAPHSPLTTQRRRSSVLSALSSPHIQHGARYRLHGSHSARNTENSRGSTNAGYHLAHREQSRIPPGTLVTVYLEHSGDNLVDASRERMFDAASAQTTGVETIMDRVRKMPNVRIVEAGET